MTDLKGKVVVITGGSSGIGLAIVKQLLKKEIKFLAMFELDNYNSRKVVEDLERVYKSRFGFYPCDVSNTSQLEDNLDEVFRTHNTVDILINNAGIGHEEDPGLMIDINYKAVVLGSLMLVKRIGKHNGGKGGLIINIASILGLQNIHFPIYCSVKHAVVSFTRTMEQHFETTGVRMIAVCPGLTDTPMILTSNKNLEFNSFVPEYSTFLTKQSPDTVGESVIKIIEEGNNGNIWVIDNNQPPFPVEERSELENILDPLKSNL